jgi:hypothetical protein
MKAGKNGSAPSVSGGRATTRPTASDREAARAVGDPQDPVAGLGRDPGPPVERERHGALRDARGAGDVGDGRATGCHVANKAV